MKDFYGILEVSRTASPEVIRASYRALAKKLHPDNKETGNQAKYLALKEAHDILTDEAKRAAYDAMFQPNADPQQGRTVWINGRGWVPTSEAGPFPGDNPYLNQQNQWGGMHMYPGQPPMDEMVQDMAGRLAHDALDQILQNAFQNLVRRRR